LFQVYNCKYPLHKNDNKDDDDDDDDDDDNDDDDNNNNNNTVLVNCVFLYAHSHPNG
jgi:hypothetical protein